MAIVDPPVLRAEDFRYPTRGGYSGRQTSLADDDRHLANQAALEEHLSMAGTNFGYVYPTSNSKTGGLNTYGMLGSDTFPFVSPGELREDYAECMTQFWGQTYTPWWDMRSGEYIDWGGEHQSAFMLPGDSEWIYTTAGQGGDREMNDFYDYCWSVLGGGNVPGNPWEGDQWGGFGHIFKMRVNGKDKQPVDWGTWGVAPNFHNHYINTYCGVVGLTGNRIAYADDLLYSRLVVGPIEDPGDSTLVDPLSYMADYWEIHANPQRNAVAYYREPVNTMELCVWDGEDVYVIASSNEGDGIGPIGWNDEGACLDTDYVYWGSSRNDGRVNLWRARYDGSERQLLWTSDYVYSYGILVQPIGWLNNRFYMSYMVDSWYPGVPELYSLSAAFDDLRLEESSADAEWLGIRMGNITSDGILLAIDEHYMDPHGGWFAGIRALATPRNEPFLFPHRGGFDNDNDEHFLNLRMIEDRVNRDLYDGN